MEFKRSKYELQINDLSEEIKRYKTSTLSQNAQIADLQNALVKFRDIEDQLRKSREHEE